MSEKTFSKPLFVWTIILLVLTLLSFSFSSTLTFAIKDVQDEGLLDDSGETADAADPAEGSGESLGSAVGDALSVAFGTALVMIILLVANIVALAVSLAFVIPGLIVSANLIKKSYGGYKIFAIIALCLFSAAALFGVLSFVVTII